MSHAFRASLSPYPAWSAPSAMVETTRQPYAPSGLRVKAPLYMGLVALVREARAALLDAREQEQADHEERPDGQDAGPLVAAGGVGDGAEHQRAHHRRALAAERVEAEQLGLHPAGSEAGQERAAGGLDRAEPGAGHHREPPELRLGLDEVSRHHHRGPLAECDHHH